MNKFKLCLVALLLILIWQTEAFAYINPGSGSEFFQIVMSLFTAFVANIKRVLHIKPKGDDNKYE